MGWLFGIGILLAVVLLVSWYCYRLAFYNRNDREDDPFMVPPGEQYEAVGEKMRSLVKVVSDAPYERVYITAPDGIQLAGRYYHLADGAPVQLLFHGYRGNGVREFCGGWALAKELGFNSLVVEQRAHGGSGGHTISFGIKERYDCVRWVRYIAERFGRDTPIVLSGVSMGAATVLMASELELPGNVVAIMADSPYSSPGEVIRKVCRDVKIPGWLAYPFVALGALVFGGFRIWESSPLEAVKNTDIPILLIHGSDDRFVPCRMSHQLRDACASRCVLLEVPGAGHGLSFLIDQETYEDTLKRFLRDCGI